MGLTPGEGRRDSDAGCGSVAAGRRALPDSSSIVEVVQNLGVSATVDSLAWVRDLRDLRIAKWTEELAKAGLKGVEILPRGAVNNGHYAGPKPRDTSWSDTIPSGYNSFVEIDLRVVLPEGQDPRDPRTIAILKSVMGTVGELDWSGENEWGLTLPNSYLYRFEPLVPAQGIGLEWEVGVYAQPVCPIDQYWEQVFGPEEIAWQRAVRQQLLAEHVGYKDEVWRVKDDQCRVGVARLVGALAMHQLATSLGEDGQTLLAIFGADIERIVSARTPNPKVTQPYVDQWLAGTYKGTPFHDIRRDWSSVVQRALFKGGDEIKHPPIPSRFVQVMGRLQLALRQGEESVDFNDILSRRGSAAF
ncbi:MAG: hypothetical protein K1X79_13740 [Oligoflexia bacterium]|nr:hypothetical protein [Oligoflexia bacterium]